jgi:hypothetical protein
MTDDVGGDALGALCVLQDGPLRVSTVMATRYRVLLRANHDSLFGSLGSGVDQGVLEDVQLQRTLFDPFHFETERSDRVEPLGTL